MADPILAGGYRAQCRWQGKSGLPEDQFVTSWAFQGPAVEPNEVAAGQIATMLNSFWQDPVLPTAEYVSKYLSPAVTRGPAALKINVYGLAQAPPREPFEFEFDVTNAGAPNPMASEIAVCASFFAGRNLPRSRGRVYIGPLGTTAGAFANAIRYTPSPALIGCLVGAMARLQADSQVAGEGRPAWCVLSQADAALKEITAGWVDDAFDVQRRRGEEAVNRSTWVA